jgi:plasmid stabilization system protein ParE
VLYRHYRIVYVVDRSDEEVEVLTIFHSSQQFGALGSAEE